MHLLSPRLKLSSLYLCLKLDLPQGILSVYTPEDKLMLIREKNCYIQGIPILSLRKGRAHLLSAYYTSCAVHGP